MSVTEKGMFVVCAFAMFFLLISLFFTNSSYVGITGNVIEEGVEFANETEIIENNQSIEEPAENSSLSENNSEILSNNSEPEIEIVLNDTETINETVVDNVVNVTINITQHQAVLGNPVKWTKRIESTESADIVIELPQNTDDVKITDSENKESGSDVNLIVPSLIEEGIEASVPEGTQVIVTVNENFLNEDLESSSITGAVISDNTEDNWLSRFFFSLINSLRNFGSITGHVISDQADVVNIEDVKSMEIEYYTEAPYAIETLNEGSKEILIVGPEDVHYQNVLAFTELPESFNIQEPSISIYWKEENTHITPDIVSDTDANGIYDYVEWTVPHLSNQTFIIEITNAQHLNVNRTFVSDIFSDVRYLDGNWSEEIPDTHYVRITFERNLTNVNDITVYPRTISGEPRIDIYESGSEEVIASFDSLVDNEYNRVILSGLVDSQDTFDLQILGGSVEFDHIIDPVGDTNIWNCTGSTIREFANSSCWSLSSVPVAGENVIFNATGTASVNITNNTLPQNISSFLVTSGYTGTIHFNPLFAVGTWGSGVGTMEWNVTNNINISGGAMRIYGDYPYNISANGSGVIWRSINGNITLGSGAIISGVGIGFPISTGPGFTSGRGAVHGGGAASNNNALYGSITSPTSLGSGSATGGGSAIRLHSPNGTITLDGLIDVAGANGFSQAGAGGSVWLDSLNIYGIGIINATGGNSATAAGGGGGGRTSLVAGNISFNGTVLNKGGTSTSAAAYGDGGSVYLRASNYLSHSLNVSTVGLKGGNITINGSSILLSGLYNASTITSSQNGTIFLSYSANYNVVNAIFQPPLSLSETISPIVTINSPTNITYSDTSVPVNITLSENGTCVYSINGGTSNISLTNTGNVMFTGTISSATSGNSYVFSAYCSDSFGNRNDTTSITFSVVDTTRPLVTINSPLNAVYNTRIINFNITLNENGTVVYSLDNGARNYSTSPLFGLTFNATNSTFLNGNYTLKIYANDTFGNRNDTESVNFSILLSHCGDTVDNDGDGYTDFFDYSCRIGGLNESHYLAPCQDSADNDGDGLIDYPTDPNCRSNQDKYEYNKSNLGINIDEISYFTTQFMFTDIFKQSGPFRTYSLDGENTEALANASLDSNGYPLIAPTIYNGTSYNFRAYLLNNMDGMYPKGNYTLYSDGNGTVAIRISGVTTEYSFPGGPYNISLTTDEGMYLEVVSTNYTDNIRNIKLYFPGYNSSSEIFYPDFYQKLENFTVIRWMEAQDINNAVTGNWSNRTLVTSQTQGGEKGLAIEHVINFSNKYYTDAWVNVYHQADDESIRQYARFLNSSLNPDLKVYIEYTNEPWNGIFSQTGYTQIQGCLQNLNTSPCNSSATNFSTGLRYLARRSGQMFDIFQQEFGATNATRLIKVFGWQSSSGSGAPNARTIMTHFHNSTINYVNVTPDAIAIAPYYGGSVTDRIAYDGLVETITTEEIIQRIRDQIQNNTINAAIAYKNVTNSYNVSLITYEGGTHVVAVNNTNLANEVLSTKILAAQRDSAIYETFHQGQDAWWQNGGELFMQFSFVTKTSTTGTTAGAYFGVMENQSQPSSSAHKYRFYVDYLNNWYQRIPPNMSISYPLIANYSSAISQLNFSVYDLNLMNCTYSLNGGTTNITMANCTTNLAGLTSNEGRNNWLITGIDTANNRNTTLVSFVVDTLAPLISIDYPTNTTYTTEITSLNYVVNDSTLHNCWYSLNGGATNTSISCTSNISGLSSSDGSNTWNVYVNDSFGRINSSTISFIAVAATAQSGSGSSGGGGSGGSGGDASIADSVSEAEETPTEETPTDSSGSGKWDTTKRITVSELNEGYVFDFQPGTRIVFNYADEIHYVGVLSVNAGVTIEVASTPQQFNLGLSETKNVDITGDSVNDVSITLEEIRGNIAKIRVINIVSQPVPILEDKAYLVYIVPVLLSSMIAIAIIIIISVTRRHSLVHRNSLKHKLK